MQESTLLQQDLDVIENWSKSWKLHFNESKLVKLSINVTSNHIPTKYSFRNTVINCFVKSHVIKTWALLFQLICPGLTIIIVSLRQPTKLLICFNVPSVKRPQYLPKNFSIYLLSDHAYYTAHLCGALI